MNPEKFSQAVIAFLLLGLMVLQLVTIYRMARLENALAAQHYSLSIAPDPRHNCHGVHIDGSGFKGLPTEEGDILIGCNNGDCWVESCK